MIDQLNDPGFSRLRVVVEMFPSLRTMSKTANLDKKAAQELPDSAFAWQDKRLYPIHNRAHAALSYGYSKIASSRIPQDVLSSLETAVNLYEIDRQAFVPMLKVASDDSYYLFPERKKFRVSAPEDVHPVQRAFFDKFAQMSVEERIEGARNLSFIARQYQVDVLPMIHKLAGETLTDTRVLKDQLDAREHASYKKASYMQRAYADLAGKFRATETYITDGNYQVKLSQAIYMMDKEAGLTDQYGRMLLDPVQTVYNTGLLRDAHIKVGSALQNRALLQQLPLSFWKDVLGEDIAQEIAPNGVIDYATLEAIIPTLPADLKSALETQLAAYNG